MKDYTAMKRRMALIVAILLLPLACLAGGKKEGKKFTVLQWNIWQEGTRVEGGYDAILDELERLKPDYVTFSEVRATIVMTSLHVCAKIWQNVAWCTTDSGRMILDYYHLRL